jgi:hypothetical protein
LHVDPVGILDVETGIVALQRSRAKQLPENDQNVKARRASQSLGF